MLHTRNARMDNAGVKPNSVLFVLISTAWLAAMTLVLGVCRAAARGDHAIACEGFSRLSRLARNRRTGWPGNVGGQLLPPQRSEAGARTSTLRCPRVSPLLIRRPGAA